MKIFRTAVLLMVCSYVHCLCAVVEDRSHFSAILGSTRNYRVYLPPGYYYTGKRYPVIYWFHGSGGSCTQTTYKSEFEAFVDKHDVIIVNVDGTTNSGSTWDYGLAFEYDTRTQEGKAALTGMLFSKYFRELVGVVDSVYRTIPDRDHRATSGQSMGGLMSPWIASQNKDLVTSASMFSPSPDAAMFGPPGKEVCFVNRELYRSLKGIPVRITAATGDRYRQYYLEQKAVWDHADLDHFEYHEINYPDHRAVGIPAQFEFHMNEFARMHAFPQNWNHADPFSQFAVWNYEVNAMREQAAITILEKVTPSGMMLCSRPYLPNGPFIQNEQVTVTTDALYLPSANYMLTDFNRSTGCMHTSRIKADNKGRLTFRTEGGGHALGIKGENQGARLFLIPSDHREEIYCEEGTEHSLDLILVNVGTGSSGPVHIRASAPESPVSFSCDALDLQSVGPGQKVEMKSSFPFTISFSRGGISDSMEQVTGISLEVRANDSLQDKLEIFIYPVPESPVADSADLLILDGNSRQVEFYNNQTHETFFRTLYGGSGNGNSIPEPGETVELYIRLPQGLGKDDRNTYHPAFLLNEAGCPWISVPQIRYNMKGAEYSGAANHQSQMLIDPDTPSGTGLDLRFKCESYEFREEGFNRPVQHHKFDYRRVILRIGKGNR